MYIKIKPLSNIVIKPKELRVWVNCPPRRILAKIEWEKLEW